MVTIHWTEEEDIALCESWVEALSQYTPRNRSSGPFRGRIFQQFCVHKGDTTRTVDALSSRFMVICLDCKSSETVHTMVENAGGNLGEDDIIQVVLINFRHDHNHEF
ncbi:hypothetical protein Hanom_Chr08g00743521 [Helianthus anomalus]